MMLRDIMTPRPECLSPEDSLIEAARKMRSLDVGSLPIRDDNDRVIGMITDRDIVVRAIAEGVNPLTTNVREVMTDEVVCGFDDQDVEEAARTMRERRIRRLVVLDRNHRLVGIIALGDLATEVADPTCSGEVLQDVSEPAVPRR
jgi:CBS domain-containing protein